MIADKDILKMIFGFKVKYLRQREGLTYQQLAEKAGMSLSYINEVEKGKKYPKPEKIGKLAKALGTDYDSLVSSKTDKKVQPILDLMSSDFVKIFPLERFGISPVKLFELFSNAPDKVNAFISTLFNITRKYQMKTDSFYKVALRSYQDLNDNYFPEIEQSVKDFKDKNGLEGKVLYKEKELRKYLKDNFGIKVNDKSLRKKKDLLEIRSYFDKKENVLYINGKLKESQRNFLIGREIGFQCLQPEIRPYITRMLEANSFEKLLNNFRASYFSAALLMGQEEVVEDVKRFAQLPSWDGRAFLKFLEKYNVTPEMFMQRLTNILPGCFGLNNLFFLRLAEEHKLKRFEITKEIHLSRLHNPYANENNEHYCRKWISVNIIKRLLTSRSLNKGGGAITDIQVSNYWGTNNEYLCLSYAKIDENTGQGVSVTLGLMVNDKLRRIIRFLGDPDLPKSTVNTTCERCSMPNCEFRAAPPMFEEKRLRLESIKSSLEEL